MRWFWIDRFVEFERGQRAVAIKNISLVEEQLDGYLPGIALMPPTLVIEGIAQTGGILVGELNHFQERVVLAKVTKAVFHCEVTPGDSLRYTVDVNDIGPDGASCRGTSHRGDELHAELELLFAFLDDRFSDELFESSQLLRWLRLLRLYEVGRCQDGSPLTIPTQLLEAEQQEVSVELPN